MRKKTRKQRTHEDPVMLVQYPVTLQDEKKE